MPNSKHYRLRTNRDLELAADTLSEALIKFGATRGIPVAELVAVPESGSASESTYVYMGGWLGGSWLAHVCRVDSDNVAQRN